jgi:hypothetical protein
MTNIVWIYGGLCQYPRDVQVLDIMLVIRIIQIISIVGYYAGYQNNPDNLNSWICFGSETHQTNIQTPSNSWISTPSSSEKLLLEQGHRITL